MASARGHAEPLPALAQDLVRAKVDVIVTSAIVGIRAAKEATTALQILFIVLNDPVDETFLMFEVAVPGGMALLHATEFEPACA